MDGATTTYRVACALWVGAAAVDGVVDGGAGRHHNPPPTQPVCIGVSMLGSLSDTSHVSFPLPAPAVWGLCRRSRTSSRGGSARASQTSCGGASLPAAGVIIDDPIDMPIAPLMAPATTAHSLYNLVPCFAAASRQAWAGLLGLSSDMAKEHDLYAQLTAEAAAAPDATPAEAELERWGHDNEESRGDGSGGHMYI